MKNIAKPFLIRDECGSVEEFDDYESALANAKECANEGASMTLYAAQLDIVPTKKYRIIKYYAGLVAHIDAVLARAGNGGEG